MAEEHVSHYRVSYGDTDRMNRVYYANYLEICERARTEMLRDIGFPYRELEARGLFFPVRSCQVRYYGYATYDDLLICRTTATKLTHATLSLTTEIWRDDCAKPLVVATVELACVGEAGKPRPLPDEIRRAVGPYAREA